VEVVGWGTNYENTPYWIIKNSYGSNWGDFGLLHILRGNNEVDIENSCTWGIPAKSWEIDERREDFVFEKTF
jgi:hypothetical protein